MHIDEFDHDYLPRLLCRLEKLTEDTVPKWGKMAPRDLPSHLADSLRLSMGRLTGVPRRDSTITRRLVKPLLLNGLIRIPRNLRGLEIRKKHSDTVETLHALLEEYLALVQAGELHPPAHPAFGPLNIDEWARLHVIHFEHHLRQFGL